MKLNLTYAMQKGKAIPAEAKASNPAATTKFRLRDIDAKIHKP